MGFSGKVNWTSRLFAMLHRHNKMRVSETQSSFCYTKIHEIYFLKLIELIMMDLVVDCFATLNCSNFTNSSRSGRAGITFQDPASCIYPDAG
jgi:hypothetical protein